jgi:NAD(P)-dependent dehydrogenase (short-subunit alcohol dehydrogenase family)
MDSGRAAKRTRGHAVRPVAALAAAASEYSNAALAAARRFVADHLDDPNLAPPMIAQALHLSVRTLHRAFGDADDSVGVQAASTSTTAARRTDDAGWASGRGGGASKAALNMLTKSWTAEYGPRGVRVNSVDQGYIGTRSTRTCVTFAGATSPACRRARAAGPTRSLKPSDSLSRHERPISKVLHCRRTAARPRRRNVTRRDPLRSDRDLCHRPLLGSTEPFRAACRPRRVVVLLTLCAASAI